MPLLSSGGLAKIFGVTRDAIPKWRKRYADFPENRGVPEYPLYDPREVMEWYARQWPGRAQMWPVRLHRFQVNTGQVKLTTTTLGPYGEAVGYLQGIRQSLFDSWRVFATRDGFSAHRGPETEVWVLDPTTDQDPEPWYVYDARFKAVGRTK